MRMEMTAAGRRLAHRPFPLARQMMQCLLMTPLLLLGTASGGYPWNTFVDGGPPSQTVARRRPDEGPPSLARRGRAGVNYSSCSSLSRSSLWRERRLLADGTYKGHFPARVITCFYPLIIISLWTCRQICGLCICLHRSLCVILTIISPVNNQYCGDPFCVTAWAQISNPACVVEGSVIWYISPSLGCPYWAVYPVCAQKWHKALLINSFIVCKRGKIQ